MGMPCEVNSILKLNAASWPDKLTVGQQFQAVKSNYRIFPIEVPIQLVNQDWQAVADVVIRRLVWADRQTLLCYEIQRIYDAPLALR